MCFELKELSLSELSLWSASSMNLEHCSFFTAINLTMILSPAALRDLIIRHSALDPKAYKLSKINKEYKAINGIDDDPPFFKTLTRSTVTRRRAKSVLCNLFGGPPSIKQTLQLERCCGTKTVT
jgi:hypothetical protein